MRGGDEGGSGEEVRVAVGLAGDLAEVEAMARGCSDGPRWPAEAWGRMVEGSGGAEQERMLLVARDGDGGLCGWLAAERVLERSELEFVLVRPACRGRGVARVLMERWMAWARMWGAEELVLEVRASHEAALRLYGGLGFREQGRRRGYYSGPVEDAVLMGRRLG